MRDNDGMPTAHPTFDSLSVEHASTVSRVAVELRRAVFEGELESGTPLREIALSEKSGEPPFRVYDPSGPYTDPQAHIDVRRGLPDLVANLVAGAGFAVVTEEALHSADLHTLAAWLDDQPEWSDFPFILLTQRGGGLERGALVFDYPSGSYTAERIELDINRVHQLRAALDQLNAEFGATTAPEPMRLLAYPGVVREERADFAPLLAEARALFEEAVVQFSDNRAGEGARLAQFMLERCDALQVLVDQIRARYPLVRDQWIERLRARCRDLGVEVEPQLD